MTTKQHELIVTKVKYIEEAMVIAEEACKVIANNPNSLGIYQCTDLWYMKEFLRNVVLAGLGKLEAHEFRDYSLVKVEEKLTGKLKGAALISFGSPWYNPNIKVVNEECTVSFNKGFGIARALSAYMESLGCDVVVTSASNTPYIKTLENTYVKHLGYTKTLSFFKVGASSNRGNN